MYKLFDIKQFRQVMADAVARGEIVEATGSAYTEALKTLNRHLEGPTPADIKKCILEQSGTQGDVYMAAIVWYEREIMKQKGTIFYGKPRRDMIGVYNQNKGRELDKLPRTYRRLVASSKYKLAFTLQMKSGLRVSELAAITREDIMIKDGFIKLYVRKGKGGKSRIVDVLPNEYLLEELPKFEKMPTVSELKTEAARLNFGTHDLRRYNARERYWRLREEGFDKYEARRMVAKQLGHSDPNETGWYLGEEWNRRKDDKGYARMEY